MSTSFYVYAARERIPTFREVLHLAQLRINWYLTGQDLPKDLRDRVRLTVRLFSDDDENRPLPIHLEGPCWWPSTAYAWFEVGGLAGGTDAYAGTREDSPEDFEDFDGVLADLSKNRELARDLPLAEAMGTGHVWTFRRSVGQPCLVHVAYGFLAAALAELTDGFLDSWDCGWDASLPCGWFPFLGRYLRPAHTLDPLVRKRAEDIIAGLRGELLTLPRA